MIIRPGVFAPPWLLMVLVMLSPAMGQSSNSPAARENPAAREKPQEGLRAVGVGVPLAMRRVAPGHWGLVGVEVVNESDEDGALEAEVFLETHAEQRFARSVWVPARAMRNSWIPVHLPEELATDGALTVVGRAEGQQDASEQSRSLLSVLTGRLVMGRVAGSTDDSAAGEQVTAQAIYTAPEEEDASYESVMAMRNSHDLGRMLLTAHERFLPPTFEGWDSLDVLVISGDQLAEDSAAQVAVRHWLSSGGRIWLQLNRTSPETARRLLGDAFRVEIVDRVPLPQFQLTGPGTDTGGTLVEPAVERPVELIRALVEGAEVLHQADGWPASFVIPFGQGEVLVTTLDAHGWMRRRTNEDPAVTNPHLDTKYVATDPLHSLTDRLFAAPQVDLPAELQSAYLTERIGYQVPERSLILAILLGFCGTIGAAGGVLAYHHRLEHLAWLTVVAAVLASASVLGMGWTGRHAVPPTVAELQTVHVLPQTNDYVASGTTARYAPEQSPVALKGTRGGRIDPVMPDLTGQIRRLVWTDLNEWHWSGTKLPPGVRLLSTHSTTPLATPVRADARFGPDGLTGQFAAGPFTDVGDALITAPYSLPMAANLQADGRFLAGPSDRLAEGQYLNEALLSEEQRRRQELYAGWFAEHAEPARISSPQLMAFAGPLPGAFQWPERMQRTGATLLTVPLRILRTPPDTSVAIPAAFIDIRAVAGAQGQSQVFDNRTRSWISPSSSATATRLRFQLPESVLPMTVQRATLTIACSIPSRVLEVFAVPDQQRELVESRSNAAGVLQIPLDNPQWLRLDEQGGLVLEIAVGELLAKVEQRTLANSGWSIHASRLDVFGRTLPASATSAEPIQ